MQSLQGLHGAAIAYRSISPAFRGIVVLSGRRYVTMAMSDASAPTGVRQQWLAKLPRKCPYAHPQDRTRLNLTVMRDCEDLGLVRRTFDGKLRLFVWNYTDKVNAFDLWDDVTCTARSLVADISGEVVGRSFPKFYDNQSKFAHKPADPTSFTVQEKLDGSLGQLFHHRGQWHTASRGSFASKQTKLANQLLASHYSTAPLDTSLTYIYELIHPDNHVVVHYKDRADLVILAAFRSDGTEVFPLPEASLAASGFPQVQIFSGEQFTSMETLVGKDWSNAEGFVVRFADGGRWKVKLPRYLLAHRAASHPSVEKLFAAFSGGCQVEDVAASDLLPWPNPWHHWNSVANWARSEWKAFEEELAMRLEKVREVHAQLLAASQGNRGQYARGAQGREDFTAIMLMFDGREEAAREAVLKAMDKMYSEGAWYKDRADRYLMVPE